MKAGEKAELFERNFVVGRSLNAQGTRERMNKRGSRRMPKLSDLGMGQGSGRYASLLSTWLVGTRNGRNNASSATRSSTSLLISCAPSTNDRGAARRMCHVHISGCSMVSSSLERVGFVTASLRRWSERLVTLVTTSAPLDAVLVTDRRYYGSRWSGRASKASAEWIVCDSQNVASVVERWGARLYDELSSDLTGGAIRRYWVAL